MDKLDIEHAYKLHTSKEEAVKQITQLLNGYHLADAADILRSVAKECQRRSVIIIKERE